MAFEVVDERYRKHPDAEIKLPERKTQGSAGYDFYAPQEVSIDPGCKEKIWTDIKVKLIPGLHLKIYPRSSLGNKWGMMLANTIGVIDMDYYNNPNNNGNICVIVRNIGDETIIVQEGERFAQGIVEPYFVFEHVDGKRMGGIGSTGKGD